MRERFTRRSFLTLAAAPLLWPAGRAAAAPARAAELPDTIRVGILGLDGHYSEVLEAARQLPGIRITAVAEAKQELRERVLARPDFAGARSYEDYRALLEHETLDVAVVTGENGTRAEMLLACAARRLPIASEKPLAISLEELEAVQQAVSAAGVPLTMLLPMRFYPVYRAMREIVRSGEIGEVVSMSGQKSYRLGNRPEWMKQRETYGGTIPFISVHMLDLMRWIGARTFTEAAAFQSNVGFPEIGQMENNAALAYRLDNGGTASLRLDFLRPAKAPTHGDDRLRIAGTRGVVEFQDATGLTLLTADRAPARITDLPPAGLLFLDFVESLYTDRPHLIRPEEAFRVTEIALKTREAAETNRVVRL